MDKQIIKAYETQIAKALQNFETIDASLDIIEVFANKCSDIAEYKQALENELANIQ